MRKAMVHMAITASLAISCVQAQDYGLYIGDRDMDAALSMPIRVSRTWLPMHSLGPRLLSFPIPTSIGQVWTFAMDLLSLLGAFCGRATLWAYP